VVILSLHGIAPASFGIVYLRRQGLDWELGEVLQTSLLQFSLDWQARTYCGGKV